MITPTNPNENKIYTSVKNKVKPTKTYRVDEHTGGEIEGLESVRQFVKLQLSYDKYKYPIYSQYPGNELWRLMGTSISYAKAELPRVIKETFMWDDRVTGISNFSMKQLRTDEILCSFTVDTIYGKYDEEYVFNA